MLSIQELLDLTASIIPNPMMLIGMDFTIIASRDWNLSDLSNSVWVPLKIPGLLWTA